MPVGEIEIERLANAMIARYGAEAATQAVARLNQAIDRGDWAGREQWACIVRAIHERQGLAPIFADRARAATRLPPAA
jgi:hypothetical protein